MAIHDHPYGVGLAYRSHLHEEVMHYAAEIDLLEIPAEDHIIRRRALSYPGAASQFAEASSRFPCLAHGISMSLGSLEPLNPTYFQSTRRFMAEAGIRVFSEHLAYHRMDGKDIASFLGMPLDRVSLDWLEQNYKFARSLLGAPFAVENVSLSFPVPDNEFTEPEFLTEFLNRTDATLLLDVTNVFNNCTNYKQDPIEFIHALPPDRISQIHLAGGHFDDQGFLVDSHSFAVMQPVWDVYREALRYTSADIVILERDYQCFPFRKVMDDVRQAREIFYELRPSSRVSDESPETSSEVPGGEYVVPDFETPELAGLRAFQRAVLKSITDDDFRRRTQENSTVAAAQFPMDAAWLDRFSRCEKLDEMSASWKETERLDREDEQRFRQWEWGQWAAIG